MKAVFFSNRAWPNKDQEISFISSKFKDDNKGGWKKLLRVSSFLEGTINYVLTLETDDRNTLTWFINVRLAVHTDMKRYMGAVFVMGKGDIISISAKKKLNLRSST